MLAAQPELFGSNPQEYLKKELKRKIAEAEKELIRIRQELQENQS